MANCGCGNKLQVGFSGSGKCSDCSTSGGCVEVAPEGACLNKEVIDIYVDIWDDPGCDGDNVVRVFNTNECTFHEGYFYWSLEDMNVDMPPSAKWTEGVTKCEMLKPYNLVNCAGKVLASGDSVPSCAELTAKLVALKTEILAAIPSPKNCAGEEADQFVACDEFADLWSLQFASSDKCLELVDGKTLCGDPGTLVPFACESGGYNLGVIPKGASCFGVIFNDVHNDIFPVDTDKDTTELYNLQDLGTDVAAGTLDLALLENSLVAEGTITIPCEGDRYSYSITNDVVLDYSYEGQGVFVFTINGVLLTHNNGSVATTRRFTNAEAAVKLTGGIKFTSSGPQVIKRYYIHTGSSTYGPAQIRRGVGTTEICLRLGVD